MMLFIRMSITVVFSLFTSRIILRELGVEDYGIYNVIGGIVSLMTFFNGSLMHGIQRYLNFYKAKGDKLSETKVFSASINILVCLALIIFVLGETLGLWFINTYLNISPDKIVSANYVYQFSILTCIIGLFQIPLMASIVANEDMQVYAYVAFIEVGLKLLIAYLLCVVLLNKLIFYSILLAGITAIVTAIYFIYGWKHYSTCKLIQVENKQMYTNLLSFSGWTVFGTSANVMSVQGVNVILNIFFGVVVNAARGIAVQVSTQLDNLINNIQVAMNPQIIQLYSAGNVESMQRLLIDNFKWNFYLFWVCACPILFNIYYVLYYWLGEVPEFTVVFTQLIIIRCLLKVFERPLITATLAYGKMKWPSIITGGMLLTEVALAWILFKIGFPPQWAYILDLLAIIGCIIYDIFFLRDKGILGFRRFVFQALPRPTLIVIVSVLAAIMVNYILGGRSLMIFIIRFITTILLSGAAIFFLGLTASQRLVINNKLNAILHGSH